MPFDCFIHGCLNLIEPYTVEVLVSVLYIFLKEKDLKYILLLVMLTRFLNALLKSVLPFIPLPNPMLEGSAFPSGHMQISSVFYIWLLFRYKSSLLKSLPMAILFCGGYAQVYCSFHYTIDIVAAPLISAFVVFSFFRFTRKLTENERLSIILAMSTFLVIILYKVGLACYTKDEYLIKTYYKILGFSIAHMLCSHRKFSVLDCFALGLFCAYSLLLKEAKIYILNQMYWIPTLLSLPMLKLLFFRLFFKNEKRKLQS
ncbi:MAG: phosphatase PAP2 family protein [Holosporales bacterium]|jgi:undecaprenyl-diphosphatase|nr:phosphatase PAP2 family protein [Holosporales bacterium]